MVGAMSFHLLEAELLLNMGPGHPWKELLTGMITPSEVQAILICHHVVLLVLVIDRLTLMMVMSENLNALHLAIEKGVAETMVSLDQKGHTQNWLVLRCTSIINLASHIEILALLLV